MKDLELHWAAGFIEGEGSFGIQRNSGHSKTGCQPKVEAAQVQRWPLEKLQSIFGGPIYAKKPRRNGNQPFFQWVIVGPKAVGIMMTVFTLISPRRRDTILNILREWKVRQVHFRHRTHCKNGHPFDQNNTSFRNGGKHRRCRTCDAANYKRWIIKRRQAA